MGTIYARAGVSHDTPIPEGEVVNDIDDDLAVVKDKNGPGGVSDYLIDSLIDDFQDEYGCKVSYQTPGIVKDSFLVFEFDVFEPSWPEQQEAEDVIDELTRRLVDWVQGYPSGR